MTQPSTEVAKSTQSGEIALWNQQRLDLLKNTIAKDLTHDEFALFVEVCKRRRLDPFAKQIHAQKRSGRLVIMTAIDGYRLIAERTGKYRGQTPPFWCGDDGKWVDVWTAKKPPFAAKIGIHRDGQIEPIWGIAYWDAYVAPGPFWQKAGPSQLSKCSESLALRKAFPEELSGLYTDDEMAQADVTTLIPTSVDLGNEVVQPVLIWPQKVVHSFTDNGGDKFALILDSDGNQWVFPGQYFDAADQAISSSMHLLVYFVIDTGRRVVTGVQQ